MARFILIMAVLVSGCFFKTSDDAPFGGTTDDVGSGNDAGTLFDPETEPTGQTCGISPLAGSTCDAVLQDCGDGRYCGLIADGPTQFKASCRLIPDEPKFDREAGEPCNPASPACAPGFFCNIDTCRRLCNLVTGLGCEEDEFCKPPANSSYGICVDTCL